MKATTRKHNKKERKTVVVGFFSEIKAKAIETMGRNAMKITHGIPKPIANNAIEMNSMFSHLIPKPTMHLATKVFSNMVKQGFSVKAHLNGCTTIANGDGTYSQKNPNDLVLQGFANNPIHFTKESRKCRFSFYVKTQYQGMVGIPGFQKQGMESQYPESNFDWLRLGTKSYFFTHLREPVTKYKVPIG